jgi:hypothetical protein
MYVLVFPVVSFLLVFPPISYMHSSSPPFMLHTLPISSSLSFRLRKDKNTIKKLGLSWQFWMKLWHGVSLRCFCSSVSLCGTNFAQIFLFRKSLWTGSDAYPASSTIGTVSSGIKLQGCEAVHSYPCRTKVNNPGAITPLSHISSWRGA